MDFLNDSQYHWFETLFNETDTAGPCCLCGDESDYKMLTGHEYCAECCFEYWFGVIVTFPPKKKWTHGHEYLAPRQRAKMFKTS